MTSTVLVGGTLIAALSSLTFAEPPPSPPVPAAVAGLAKTSGQYEQMDRASARYPFHLQGASASQTEGFAAYGGVAETGQQRGGGSANYSIHSLFVHH